MRPILLAILLLFVPAGLAAQDIPRGKLSDAATPIAYRLDLKVLPEQPRFSGHTEIDIMLNRGGGTLYLHGRDLEVTSAFTRVGGRIVKAKWRQVDPLGVAELTFAEPLASGRATLVFDYSGAFGDGPAGFYRVKVGNDWYSWTQFESIDARAAFPSFDEPGFKTPFTVSLTTSSTSRAISNAPETGTQKSGSLIKHVFAPTQPLPTYLVAFVVGPFITAEGSVPANRHRAAPLPLRIVATKAQAGKLGYALEESKRIVTLLEDYFDQGFPFPKLDQIGSPIMPGAMENAGADIYGDDIILLDPGATTIQKQTFGMVVAHELSHQWFGDLVTPAWWDDIWLNESFANWMGYRIGNEWRPELNIGVGAVNEGFAAMHEDALVAGRPIRQPIVSNGEIDSAFDSITYGKGGQVVAMIAAYMGDEKFRSGVRLHLSRHPYGNATSEEFFAALADAVDDPRVLAAMKSFVDQQGVPVVRLSRDGSGYSATQTRYVALGGKAGPEQWTIPFCFRTQEEGRCQLLEGRTGHIDIAGKGPLIPNAGGTGYYRFDLDAPDWEALIALAPTLPAGEALATTDSLWASFQGGGSSAAQLIEATELMADNRDSNVALDGGFRFSDWAARGVVPAASLPDYRRLIDAVFAPRLARLGFDPAAGAHSSDDPDRQKLRQEMVILVANEARDVAVRAKLAGAARAYLAGDRTALDQSFLRSGIRVVAEEGDLGFRKDLAMKAIASEDAGFRDAALNAVGRSGDVATARWLLDFRDPRLRSTEKLSVVGALLREPATRALATEWLLRNYDIFSKEAGIFSSSGLPSLTGWECATDRADTIERTLAPKIKASGKGELDFRRTMESIRNCAALREARSGEIASALRNAQ
jgi:aminopeptidase N